MNEVCDLPWDLVRSSAGNLPRDPAAYRQKYAEWEGRDWLAWLSENLSFPFEAKRIDDDDDAYFTDIAKRAPFRLGHVMQVLSVDSEDTVHGILVKVKEGGQFGTVPLFDLEVQPRKDVNFGLVREYVVWDANK